MWKVQFWDWNFDWAEVIIEGEASMPVMEPEEEREEAIWAVKIPSPQPRSRIWSVGWGFRYCRTLVVSLGTKEAAEE